MFYRNNSESFKWQNLEVRTFGLESQKYYPTENKNNAHIFDEVCMPLKYV